MRSPRSLATSLLACDVADGFRLGAAVVASSVVLGLAGCGQSAPEQPTSEITVHNDDGMHGAVLSEQYVAPDIPLTSTDGRKYSLAQDTDKPLTLVFFGYTHCPDICHVVMADIASALNRLDQAQREQIDVVFITTDPSRDDPATLREYLDRFDPRFEGLSGDLGRITAIGEDLGVGVEKGARLPSGGYEVAHGTQIVAINERDRSPIVWTEGTSSQALAQDLVVLLENGATKSEATGDGA